MNTGQACRHLIFLGVSCIANAWGQPASTPAEPPADPLGRSTPRGTVRAFLNVCRKNDYQAAAEYLNTRQRGKAVETLAQQLYFVLDRHLPARLNEVSDRPEGSLSFPSKPNLELIGTIETPTGHFDVLVERVDRGKAGSIWLFSSETLKLIPQLYDELDTVTIESLLPSFLIDTEILKVPLFEWLAVVIGLPGLYLLGTILNRLLSSLAGRIYRGWCKTPEGGWIELMPPPVRLLLMAGAIQWGLARINLPLLARHFWSSLAYVLTASACVWLLILLNGLIERYFRSHLSRTDRSSGMSLLRFGRRTVDLLVIIIGVLVVVYHFGLNPTAAIAGLGVGGIAVALAAQKTLENVIGGISLIFDNPLQIGELVKVSGTFGRVEYIGLRSTQIRTLDRTLVCVPNGQLANLILENVSRRDKFWFHPLLNLPFDVASADTRAVIDSITRLLASHPLVESDSLRVNALNFGSSSLEIEVFAYLRATDWNHFTELQGKLLLQIMDVLDAAGVQISIPSQAVYFANSPDGQAQPILARRDISA